MKKILLILSLCFFTISCTKDNVQEVVDTSKNPKLISVTVDGKESTTVVVK